MVLLLTRPWHWWSSFLSMSGIKETKAGIFRRLCDFDSLEYEVRLALLRSGSAIPRLLLIDPVRAAVSMPCRILVDVSCLYCTLLCQKFVQKSMSACQFIDIWIQINLWFNAAWQCSWSDAPKNLSSCIFRHGMTSYEPALCFQHPTADLVGWLWWFYHLLDLTNIGLLANMTILIKEGCKPYLSPLPCGNQQIAKTETVYRISWALRHGIFQSCALRWQDGFLLRQATIEW